MVTWTCWACRSGVFGCRDKVRHHGSSLWWLEKSPLLALNVSRLHLVRKTLTSISRSVDECSCYQIRKSPEGQLESQVIPKKRRKKKWWIKTVKSCLNITLFSSSWFSSSQLCLTKNQDVLFIPFYISRTSLGQYIIGVFLSSVFFVILNAAVCSFL